MDDIDLLKQFRKSVPEPGPEIMGAARAAMFAELKDDSTPIATRRLRQPRRNGWRVALGVAAAAVAVAIALPAILPHGGPGSALPAAAATLHRFARIAAKQPAGAAPQAGQFVYTKSQWVNVNSQISNDPSTTFSVIQPVTREAWIGVDGSGRLLETTGISSFPTPADEAAWKAAGSPDLAEEETSDTAFDPGPEGLYFVDLSELPTDPVALRKVLEARQIEDGPAGDAETFTIVGDLLRETYGSPALRAALYEVAASLPGVELVGNTTDASGRPGIAVAYVSNGSRDELIFDPQTAELLGETSVAIDGNSGVPAGSVLSSSVFLASGVVDSTHDTP
jgi:hypothetical protein